MGEYERGKSVRTNKVHDGWARRDSRGMLLEREKAGSR